jgi:hypothetical protein
VTDRHGALPIPRLPVPGAADTVADPLIDYTLAYFAAVLNAHADAAWRAVFAASGPVKRTFAHDPEQHCFGERDLPALYLWRSGGAAPEQIADDWHLKRSNLTLLWVLPGAVQHPQHRRLPFVNGLVSLLHVAIEKGRDPAWHLAGDPDPTARARGSVWPRWAGFFELALGKWKPGVLVISDGARKFSYASVEVELLVAEHWERDLAAYDPNELHDLDVIGSDAHSLGRHRLR